MSFVIEDVLIREDPPGDGLPLVFDSPHSGNRYPADFAFVCPELPLRQAEDTYVDELFASVPDHGGTLLSALFPRTYIDVNRSVDDIDPTLLDGPCPWPVRPGDKSAAGMGLIRRLCRPGMPLYDGRLPVAEVVARVERYYRPYHEQLAEIIARLHRRWGRVYHIDCHSMPSIAVSHRSRPPDFVLGDRDGTTCDPALTRFVAKVLEGRGYRVALNDPYKGVELVRRYSAPARGIHSLQIEICRALYMNEDTLEKHEGFDVLRNDLDILIGSLAAHARVSAAEAAE